MVGHLSFMSLRVYWVTEIPWSWLASFPGEPLLHAWERNYAVDVPLILCASPTSPLAPCVAFRPCRSMLSGRNYTVQHGDSAVRPAPMSGGRCQRCTCQDGRLQRCMNTTRGNCMVVRPPTSGSQRNCMIRGRMVPHGNRTKVRYTLISLYVL